MATVSILAVTALLARSATGIFYARHAALADCGDLVVRSLPADGGILLAGDAALLLAVKASLAQHADGKKWQTVDVQQLPGAKYRAALEAKYPAGWHTNGAGDLTPGATLDLLNQIAHRRRLFYLLPEPGHFLFEGFYPQPEGAAHELKNYPGNTFAVPGLTAAQIAANEKFWDAAWEKNLLPVSRIAPAAAKTFPHRLALAPVPPDAARQLGRWYSIALNNWGVELQRNGKLAAAGHRFEQAKLLNPENPAPPVNLVGNSNLLAGKNLDLSGAAALAKSVSGVQQLARLVESYGTFDEPSVCVLLGEACFNAGWPRQALQQLDRARMLAPDSGVPELSMAKIYSRIGVEDQVLELVKKLRRFETNSPAGRALGLELSVLEAKAWLARTNAPEANRVLETVLQKNPNDPAVWETVFKAYLAFGSATNALGLLDRLLAKEPDNISALNNKAAVFVQLQRAAEAVPILNRAIALTNLPAIRLNRAIALLQSQDLPAAETAYLELQTNAVDQFSVKYGLAQIAEMRHDTNAAMKYYSICLTNATTGSLKWLDAKARLAALQKPAAPR